ncbi:MAG: hypothetical protein ISR96_06135 [Nitrospira sp.]|nr:hypothetical protein [Nitrospira sp.]
MEVIVEPEGAPDMLMLVHTQSKALVYSIFELVEPLLEAAHADTEKNNISPMIKHMVAT